MLTSRRSLASGNDRLRAIPDLSEAGILGFTAGLRPYRASGLRIERERRFTKNLIHNYGHGGGGFTLAWGSAAAAVDLIRDLAPRDAGTVAVIGGGIIGLSTAWELLERGYRVRIYAEKWWPQITSAVAGGQWSASHIGEPRNAQEASRYGKILEVSFKKYFEFQGSTYGVYMRDNIIADGTTDPLQDLAAESYITHTHVDRLPFAGSTLGGDVYRSWMIEPPFSFPGCTGSFLIRAWNLSPALFHLMTLPGSSRVPLSRLQIRRL